jgi:hypothetical protein
MFFQFLKYNKHNATVDIFYAYIFHSDGINSNFASLRNSGFKTTLAR